MKLLSRTLGIAILCAAQTVTFAQNTPFQITEAPKMTPTIDGDPSDWANVTGFQMEFAHGQRGGDPSSDPLVVEIKYAWDDDRLYHMITEISDDDPTEGITDVDWCQECTGSEPGPAPWSTDSIGFYDKGIKWPGVSDDPLDANILEVGPWTQYWVGLTTADDMVIDGVPQYRHLTRSIHDGGGEGIARLIGPESVVNESRPHLIPDLEDVELTDPQSAFAVLDTGANGGRGQRTVEFFMEWDQIRYSANDLREGVEERIEELLPAIEGHLLEDVKEGYEFRLEPLLVDGIDDFSFGSQTHPSGVEHPDTNHTNEWEHISVVRLVKGDPLPSNVWVESSTASKGAIDEGSGQALYGGFGRGANNPDDPQAEYLNYRKYGAPGPDIELPVVTPNPSNPNEIEYSGQYHCCGGEQGIIDAGMFIGTEAKTASDPEQLLYFKPLIDEETGVDENGHRDWDLRFGFLEDPESFVDSRDPNDESWDLWSGEWSSDGLSMQINIGSNIDGEETDYGEGSDWYVRNGQGGIKLNAADSVFNHEGSRDTQGDVVRTLADGEEVEEAGLGDNVFAGVGYDEAIEISWEMNEIEGSREVEYSLKVGNNVFTGTFDPGDENNEVAPNSDGEPYSDGYFDWQNATPVFFVAPTGGTPSERIGVMGIFEPGDANADGVVDSADGAIIEAFMGQTNTTFSRGDLNQDGMTDADDLAIWQAIVGGGDGCDVNGDGTCDAADIDAMSQMVIDGTAEPQDRTNLIESPMPDGFNTYIGDSDLNGVFDEQDIVAGFIAGKYLTGEQAGWAEGDWDGDLDFDDQDFVAAFIAGGYLQGPRAGTAAVPEPSSFVLLGLGLLAFARRRR